MIVQVDQVNLKSYNLSSDLKRGRGQVAKSTCQVNLSSLSSGTCHRKWDLSPVGFVTYEKNLLASAHHFFLGIIASAPEKVFARFSSPFFAFASLSKSSVFGWTTCEI